MGDNLSTSEEALESTILEENARIRRAIVSWTQGKVNKDRWEALRESFNNIIIKTRLDADEFNCVIKCFCGASYNISKFTKKASRSKRWIYSNFQMHLLRKYIFNTNLSATKLLVNKKNRITDYVVKTPSKFSNAEAIHDIEFADTDLDANQVNYDKWKSFKYQRSERLKRAREKLNPNQPLITDYFILAEKIAKIVCDNFEVRENLLPKIKDSEIDSAIKDNGLVINNFLKKLVDISLKNVGSANRNSYDEVTMMKKKLSIYLYYVGGRLLYETLHANLPNTLPSISTLNRYLSSEH